MNSEAQHFSPTTTTDSFSKKYLLNINKQANAVTKGQETQEIESAIISIKLPPKVFNNQKKLSTIFKTISNALMEPTMEAPTSIPGETLSSGTQNQKEEQSNPKVR